MLNISQYTQAGEWQSAANMFRANDQWDEAVRVAELNGGIDTSKRVASAWATSLGGEDAAKMRGSIFHKETY